MATVSPPRSGPNPAWRFVLTTAARTAGLALAGLLGAAGAPALTDPMQPSGTSAPPPADTAARPVAPPRATLDSPLVATRRDAQGHWTALLGNLWFEVGERVDDARIVSISESDVVLTRGGQRIALTLLPLRTTPAKP